MVLETGLRSLDEARAALAAEWKRSAPLGADRILRFYETSSCLADDLDAWHQTPERQSWTQMLVHVAQTAEVSRVVDIGCGAGHDLLALREALPDVALFGVEPNARLRDRLTAFGLTVRPHVEHAPIDMADLLVCVDVLEHIPDPEAFLLSIADEAPVGCLLFEATATHDITTPLHLEKNHGWHPGRVLESVGWVKVDEAGRTRVWQRIEKTGRQTASILLCAYRDASPQTTDAVDRTVRLADGGWRKRIKHGDADIGRARAIIVTQWWTETNDDVFLMVDADIGFTPNDADHVIELCRSGLDIVCGAYPVHNGEHLALRCFPGTGEIQFGPGNPPVEIEYPSTGFMAVHRRVIDALVERVPLCHASAPWAFYPLFQQPIVRASDTGEWLRLSEDWGFGHAAREIGFRVWLDPTVKLSHLSTIPVSVNNMREVYDAIQQA